MMEKLEKVIAGLRCCIKCDCRNCDYSREKCESRLLEDALSVIEHLSAENQELRYKWADAVLELGRVQHERDFWASLDRKE